MVVGKPYIHFKVNNEPIEEVVDYNYTWATIVEASKGPINTPVYVEDATQAYSIFGVDMNPYFAQNPKSLIIVRAAASSDTNIPQKGKYSFNTQEPITIYKALQDEITLTNKESYIDSGATKWKDVKYTFKLFYTVDDEDNHIPVIEHRDSNGVLIPESYIDAWHNDGRIVTEEDVAADASKPEASAFKPEEADATKRYPIKEGLTKKSTIYNKNQVKEFLTPVKFVIPAGEPLFEIESQYEGIYDISISCSKALVGDGYRILVNNKAANNSLLIPNGFDVHKIVNRINDTATDVVAKSTTAGDVITAAMHAYPTAVETKAVTGHSPLITSPIVADSYILTSKNTSNGTISYLTLQDLAAIQNYTNGVTSVAPTVEQLDYAINLVSAGEQSLVGGNRGEWDVIKNRISNQYQAEAHRNALKTLRRIRLAGIFCMYGEEAIQYEYLQHGMNDLEPEKGMNNNETCKWRTILLGANEENRSDINSLMAKAKSMNNEYVLFLGQGLIDTGFTGIGATLTPQQKQAYGIVNDHHLLPYECTQYIAGLRSKLFYGESIFGGQGRKRIRSVGDLDIAPITSYETEYIWDPNTYTRLNEAGVLTFTEDYGNITLTDGVTTVQTGAEEDEEGVMNILKYAENAIYDVCLPYIGRNIDVDLENSITTAIEKVLEQMKTTDQTLIDTEEYPAYNVSVSLNSRKNQLLGRIFVYVQICPVHAVRQIEVEMTVQ